MKNSVFLLGLAVFAALSGCVHGDGAQLSVWTCQPGSSDQVFTVLPDHYHQIVFNQTGACVDIDDYGTTDGSAVWLYSPCHPEDTRPEHQNEAWTVHSDGRITSDMSGKCLTAAVAAAGSAVEIDTCQSGNERQQWVVDGLAGTLKLGKGNLCLDGGQHAKPSPCDGQALPFCDLTLPRDVRVRDLVGRLTTEEKLGLFANGAKGVPRLNIPSYQWWSEALHGVGHSPGVSFGGKVKAATSFPQIVGMGAAFNRTLIHEMATVISTEGRAMNNLGQAGLTFWAPNINLQVHPRWGRNQETAGEDPYWNGEYATEFASGMQGNDGDRYLRVSSCLKHYYAYNLENWHGVDRHHFDAMVTAQDSTDTYLPAFEAGIVRGKASGVMCSYNSVNGVPSCANKEILTTILRNTWGAEVYTTSDCGAVADVYSTHKYAPTEGMTCNDVLTAGMDIDCGSFLDQHLGDALSNHTVAMDSIDTALFNLFMIQFRLGMFDPFSMQPYKMLNETHVNTPAHQQLALFASRQSMVLLQNNGKFPLDQPKIASVAVVGPSGNATNLLQGNYQGTAPYLISPLAGIQKYTHAEYAAGCSIAGTDKSGFAAAEDLARTSDATVIVVGLDEHQESEGHDRTILSFPGVQDDFIAAVAGAAKGPVAVMVMSGGPVDMSKVKANPNVDAIFYVGYPGQSGGEAMADVLFGAYNPGGRLPHTVYPAAFADQVTEFDMGMRPNASSGNPGHSYRFYTGEAVFEFGHGLSYTTFSEKWTSSAPVTLNVTRLASDLRDTYRPSHTLAPMTSHTVEVTNTGDRAGDDVVMLYVVPPHPGQDGAPLKSLRGVERVHLQRGESRKITFDLNARDFTFADAKGQWSVVPGEWRVRVGEHDTVVHVQ